MWSLPCRFRDVPITPAAQGGADFRQLLSQKDWSNRSKVAQPAD
jgi:hypothetical protein